MRSHWARHTALLSVVGVALAVCTADVEVRGPARVVLAGAEIHDGRGGVWRDAWLVAESGIIRAVGSVPPRRVAGETIADLRTRVVIPGLIDASSSLLAGQGFAYDRDSPSAPNLRVEDALLPLARFHAGPAALMTGLTVAYLSPGSWRPIGGQGVIVQLEGESILDMQLPGRHFLHFAINSGPLFVPGRGPAMPHTTMGIVGVIRRRLAAARDYLEARTRSDEERPSFDPELETLAQVLTGERIARIDADSARDIQSAIALADEFGFRPILDHCVEAHKVRALLAERKYPVVLLPFTQGNVLDLDEEREILSTPGWLAARGVPVAFQTHGHGMPPYANLHPYSEPRSLFLDAILQVRMGMDREEVLRAMTSTPAAILGIDDRVGSLEAGRRADFVVLDGPPFEYTTRILEVWIGGRQVFDASDQQILTR